MTFNTDLAERVLAQIKDHPETWNQDWWASETPCGTAYCFAGWACALEGLKESAHFDGSLEDGRLIFEVAADLLNLSPARWTRLFAALNSRDRLELLVKHFANNPDDDSLPEDES